MDELAARATLVSAPDVGDGLTTTVLRSEIEEVLASEGEPIQLVLDVARFADREATDSRSVAISWERSDLERLLEHATGEHVTLTFDRGALEQAMDADVEAHGFREIAIALAIAGTAATGMAAGASANPADLGSGPVAAGPIAPDDRAVPRPTPPVSAPAADIAPDDRAVPRVTPVAAPGGTIAPDDRAVPRPTPVTPTADLAPDDRAVPRATPVSAPAPDLAPDDRAAPRPTPVATPTVDIAPDDRAVPRPMPGTPVTPPIGTVSDPGISWSPSPAQTAGLAGAIALVITGAFFLVGGRRIRPRPT